MILIDSSAWIEFLRGTDSPICRAVEEFLASDIAVADPIVMEVLAGARSEHHLSQLRGLLGRAVRLRLVSADFDTAARIYRQCRAGGETVRRLIDCLIAAVAIRNQCPVLHADADFRVITRHTALTEAPVRRP